MATTGMDVNQRLRQMLPLVAWVVALAVALVTFTAIGTGRLAAPALTDPGSWAQWADGRDPVIATAALLRVVVLGLAWYLLGVTVVGAIARVVRLAAMVRVADALTVPMVRRVLQTSLGVSLATAVAVSSAPHGGLRTGPEPVFAGAAQEVDAPSPPRMRPLPPHADPSPAPAPRDDAVPPPLAPDPPRDEAAPGPIPPPEASPPDLSPTGDAADAADAATVTVRSGDHLWSIAEHHLGAHLDAAPSDQQVAAYWQRLIDANRDRLADPANPDLILPGQQFVLPDDPDAAQERT